MTDQKWPADKVERRKVVDLIPYARNSRTHSDEQVGQIAASIKEWGWTVPVLIDPDGGLIAGHGRILAAQKLGITDVPCMVAEGWTDAQKQAYIIADNKLALNAGWDDAMLKVELGELDALDFDLSLTGFGTDELAAFFVEETEGLTDEDVVPDAPEVPVTVEGDVWLLGRHRLMCGDSTSIDAVERLMDGQKAALLHADPPYGMGKESEGVANDNLYQDKLDAFQMEWWTTFRCVLEDNASAYIWGNAPDLWRLWYSGGLSGSERMTIRNQIVWDKKYGFGMSSEQNRMFPTATEHCLFFMLGEQGFNNNADNYWEGWDSVVNYLREEKEKTGWDIAKFKRLAGHSETSGCHWFDKSQWSFPTKDVYNSWQTEAKGNAFKRDYDELKRDHDELKRDHDELKREFYATRAYFDNAHDNMTDVWGFGRVTGEERYGHATPKPVEMMQRVMRSSLATGGLCVEPFGGSGSTLMGAERTGRVCYSMELDPKYCDVIIQRWQDFTGLTATLEATDQTFTELQAERGAARI